MTDPTRAELTRELNLVQEELRKQRILHLPLHAIVTPGFRRSKTVTTTNRTEHSISPAMHNVVVGTGVVVTAVTVLTALFTLVRLVLT